MRNENRKSRYKRIAMVLSLCAILVWGLLGTGASLAWFSDTTPEIHNIFHFADFDLRLYHQLPDGSWEEVDGQTKLFREEDLFEPGYTQVVYLMVENNGDVPFEFNTMVRVSDQTLTENVYGDTFELQKYLKFGLVTSKDETALKASLSDRQKAVAVAVEDLGYYSSQAMELEAGGFAYIALIVHMPESVGDEANYRGNVVPEVELGIIVEATQLK